MGTELAPTPTPVETAKPIDLVDLEQLLSDMSDWAHVKCEAGNGHPCTIEAVARVVYCKPGFNVCQGGVDLLKEQLTRHPQCAGCNRDATLCWKLVTI